MGEFHGLDGMEDAGIVKGPQEKATEKFINRFREARRTTPWPISCIRAC